MYFVDYEKAFDKAKHVDLCNMLKAADSDGKNLRLMRNFYWKQKSAVRVADEESSKQKIRSGVRQGLSSRRNYLISRAK